MFGPFRDELEFFRLLEDKYHSGADVSDDYHITEVDLRELLSPQDFDLLVRLPQLRHVNIFCNDYTEKHLLRLPKLLTSLSSSSNSISLQAIGKFCAERPLTELSISGFTGDSMNPENWSFLTEMLVLSEMDVECQSLPAAYFSSASKAPTLRKLTLAHVEHFDRQAFDAVSGESPLQELAFFDCPGVMKNDLSALSRLKQLNVLLFVRCGNVARCLQSLRYTDLTYLLIEDDEFVSAELELQNFPSLRTLQLNRCKVTDADLERFSNHGPLRHLTVHNTSVSISAIVAVVEKNKKLIICGPEDILSAWEGRHHKDWDPKYLKE
ncbi:MAG: hypothetical protein JNL58_19200 [Planctomyces sp.]|nr:hypothetical protein [Planctomyces sp.]